MKAIKLTICSVFVLAVLILDASIKINNGSPENLMAQFPGEIVFTKNSFSLKFKSLLSVEDMEFAIKTVVDKMKKEPEKIIFDVNFFLAAPGQLDLYADSIYGPKIQDSLGDTLLQHFCSTLNYDARMIKKLLDKGADPNGRDWNWDTPLHLCVHDDKVAGVQILLSYGANPDSPDKEGNTPLHIACQNNFLQAAKVLLNNQANPTIKNQMGETPDQVASKFGYKKIADLLTKASHKK